MLEHYIMSLFLIVCLEKYFYKRALQHSLFPILHQPVPRASRSSLHSFYWPILGVLYILLSSSVSVSHISHTLLAQFHFCICILFVESSSPDSPLNHLYLLHCFPIRCQRFRFISQH